MSEVCAVHKSRQGKLARPGILWPVLHPAVCSLHLQARRCVVEVQWRSGQTSFTGLGLKMFVYISCNGLCLLLADVHRIHHAFTLQNHCPEPFRIKRCDAEVTGAARAKFAVIAMT